MATLALLTRQHQTGSERIYQGEVVSLRVDKVQEPGGASFLREVVEHNGGVVIACQPEPHQVVLIKQYRYSIDEDLLELPAGRLEPGEEPLPAARRELAEETGYRAVHWELLSRMVTAPGFCNEVLYLYRASGLDFVGKNLDYDEETEVQIVDIREAWQMVVKGEIRDAKTIAGIALIAPQSLSLPSAG